MRVIGRRGKGGGERGVRGRREGSGEETGVDGCEEREETKEAG
jgi:hypothetical protein